MATNSSVNVSFEGTTCSLRSSAMTAYNSMFMSNIVIVLISIKVCHYFLGGFFHQPRIISEFVMGLILAQMPLLVDEPVIQAFTMMDVMASSTYMFVLGLEMDPRTILERPGPDAVLAYSTLISTWVIICLAYIAFNLTRSGVEIRHPIRVLVGFVIVVSATSSPIVTRMATELKLGKSEIGRRAIRAALFNDMICTLIMCLLMTFTFKGYFVSRDAHHLFKIFEIQFYLAVEVVFVMVVGRFFLLHMNSRNPEGKPIRGIDMFLVAVFTQGLCYWPQIMGYNTKMNAFLVGLFLPREGRISNFIISKTNYALTSFILPLYLTMAGLKTNRAMFQSSHDHIATHWVKLSGIITMSTVGKLTGTLIAGKYQGLHWLEAITLGLMLNIKGYFLIFFTFYTKKKGLLTDTAVMVMMVNVMTSIVFVPPMVKLIVKYVRLRAGKPRQLGLQWLNPESSLRMTVCLHGPHNVPAAVNLIEMMRAAAAGLQVQAMDMIELTNRVAVTIVYGSHGADGLTIMDESVAAMREEIGAALDTYMDEKGGDDVRIRRTLALSGFSDMHEDVCNGAQDSLALIVILPFHRIQAVDGSMEDGPAAGGFRTVTRNMLQSATCSVGILVDRGLGRNTTMSALTTTRNVAVLFIGGIDDREALAYAGCMGWHPRVRLTVIRFMVDEHAAGRVARRCGKQRGGIGGNKPSLETRKDDEYVAGFYESFAAGGREVGYMEKSVNNGAGMVATLRAVEGEFELFIVGRGESRDSVLTSGLSEWAEYPELGTVGDILASSDFSITASVLVIQQYNCRNPLYISDEFLPL